ncbi:MAG: hypothetical protein H6765_11225 [Candidatus Peribacteria bacterium]|nr:MAG: hypothetical protein H6765_11225 [Candidatus Peribacteria bacterium]
MTPPSFETNNDGFSGWLAYPSIRGFTLYFSNPSISYAGEIRDTTDLGIDGLSCNYQVNIIQWQNAAAIDSNPDVLVYECAGDVSASALSAANLQKIGTTEEDTFVLVKYLSNNLSDLQI